MNAISKLTVADFVTIEGRALAHALKPLLFIVERRVTMPILSTVRIAVRGSALTLAATDIDIEVATRLDVIDCHGDWSVCVSPRVLAAVARAAGPAPLRIEPGADGLHLSTDDATYELMGLSSDGFPTMPGTRGELLETFGNGSLPAMLGKVSWCVSSEEVRYYLNGVAWQWGAFGRRLVATDGHKLALCRYDPIPGKDRSVIIPAKTVKLIERFFAGRDIAVHAVVRPNEQGELVETSRLEFATSDTTIRTKLIEGDYPHVDRAIPKEQPFAFHLSQDEMLGAIARATAVGGGRYAAVRVHPIDGRVAVSMTSVDAGTGSARTTAAWPKKAPDFGANARYFRDALTRCSGSIVLGVTDAGSPLTISDDDETMTRMVMPMRV